MGQRGFGATATETLFNGFQTANKTRQAESQVMAARDVRVTEQQVLLDAGTSYMNLLRDGAILDLNVVTSKASRATQADARSVQCRRGDADRRRANQITIGRWPVVIARRAIKLRHVGANYRRVIGVDHGKLTPGTPVDRLSPAVVTQRGQRVKIRVHRCLPHRVRR